MSPFIINRLINHESQGEIQNSVHSLQAYTRRLGVRRERENRDGVKLEGNSLVIAISKTHLSAASMFLVD